MIKNNEKGRSFIEFMGIFSLILIYLIYNKMVEINNISKTHDQIDEIVMGIHQNYSNLKTYQGLTSEMVYDLNILHQEMLVDKSIINPFNGEVIITPAKYDEDDEDEEQAFFIIYTNLKSSDCINVSTIKWDTNNNGFMSMGIFGSDYELTEIQEIMNENALLNNISIVDEYGIVAADDARFPMPLSKDAADYFCNCSANNEYCTVVWKYY